MFDPENVRAVTAAIQKASALSFVLALGISLILAARYHRLRPFLIVAITVCIHTVIFYVFALADVLVSPWGNFWSAILRLHTGIAFLGTLIAVGLALSRKQDGYGQ